VFEFLFKYRSVLYERGRLELGAPWLLALGGLLALALLTPTLLRYARAAGRTNRGRRAVLIGLRVTALGVVLVVLCRPALVLSTVVPQQSFVGVLVDDSLSMRVDDLDGESRADAVRAAIGEPGAPLRAALAERFKLRWFRFEDTAERLPRIAELGFAGQRTDLAGALERARQELAGVPLAGLVMISDGADNADGPLTEALLALKARGLPVYTVGVGRERFDRDVEVARVETPGAVLEGTALVADVLLRQRGYARESVELRVEDGGRVVHTESVALSPTGEDRVRVHVTASEPGPRVFRFRVAARPDEQVAQNNEREVLIRVADREEKILYFEGEPRFELKFVRRAMGEDHNVRVVTLLRTSENKYWRGDVDDGEELAGGFPRTREELYRYRGLILGSVEASSFGGDQLRMIADFVSQRGGGLLMLGGRSSFSEGGYGGTPVADALPVLLEGPAPADAVPERFFSDVKVALTPYGRTHGVTRIDADEGRSAERWSELPPLSVVNPVHRAKPGAATLLTGSLNGRQEPQVVLAYQRYGRGKALAFTVQDSWQWQMHADMPLEDQTHEGLWQQLLRWLVADVPGPVEVSSSRDRVSPGRAFELRAVVCDDTFLEVNDARVVAHVRDPAGREREVPMEWTVERDGEYTARVDTFEPGFYEVRVEAQRGETLLGEGRTWVQAAPLDSEYFAAERRGELLRRVAEETGGRYYDLDDALALAEDLSYTESGVTVVERRELWDMPASYLAVLLLACSEWGLRRLWGLA
jgi:uncharacterized membrane protein